MLLVHGFGSSFDHGWRQGGWVDLLGDAGRDVIPIDLPGHGRAEKPHDPAAYAGMERAVEAVLPGEPVDAVGFSLGAQLLLRLAVEDASRFARLVLVGVGENLFRDEEMEPLARAFEAGGSPDDVTARLFVNFSSQAGNDPRALAAVLRRPRRRFTLEELAAVRCPTLVVIGDRDFAGPADRLAGALPNATLTVLPGVDHFQAVRDFRCIDAVLDFLGAGL